MSGPRAVTLCGRALAGPSHMCAFFDSRNEEYELLTPFYQEGITLDEEVVTIVGAERYNDHLRRLSTQGVEVDTALANGRLQLLTTEDTYVKGGSFGAQRMYEMLQAMLADAHQRGHRVRAAGDMDWALHGAPGSGELMEYEARVNLLLAQYDCTLICVYDINEINGRMAMEILRTHPSLIYRRRLRENPYYVGPIVRPGERPIAEIQPRRQLSFLQRDVIQRLRDSRRYDLAELALAAWQDGRQTPWFGTYVSEQLRADFDRANTPGGR